MSASDLPVIDRTIHETNHWLRQIMDRLKTNDRHRAYSAMRIVLHIMRDCMPTENVAQFAAQLPLLIRGIYYEGWQPGKVQQHRVTREHVVEILAAELGPMPKDPEIEEIVTAVIDTILDSVDEGAGEKLIRLMPTPLQQFWLVGNTGE